ncbi:hypothetical protein BDR26DRAFT_923877 [Obelidium mucronatum]|nr:hypothetical protein BDR26DRAFT_923877 [Obelidium mucronatum]
MLSPERNAPRSVRAHGSLEDAIASGGRIAAVHAHAHNKSLATVFVRIDAATQMVFANVGAAHAAALCAADPSLPHTDTHTVTRAHGSLEQALAHNATVSAVHPHDNNNSFSVTVHVPKNAELHEAPENMVYTAVSLDHLQALGETYPTVAAYLEEYNLHLFHPSKLLELLQEPGAKICGWHPTMSGVYSIHVACGDGCQRSFSSVTEEHMKQFLPGFIAGSSQFN